MTHLSEDSRRLIIERVSIAQVESIRQYTEGFGDVCMLILPSDQQLSQGKTAIADTISAVTNTLQSTATLITIGDVPSLVHIHANLSTEWQYQLWIAIKNSATIIAEDSAALPQAHFGALVHTKYAGSLKHTKTRIEYSWCPACDKTTKDYGGKKHTYHPYGTLMSDVWRDISADLDGDLSPIIERFADLFGLPEYRRLLVLDCRKMQSMEISAEKKATYLPQTSLFSTPLTAHAGQSQLLQGDVLEELRKIPDNSVDFCFADPPYNLKKKYQGYSDDLSIAEYFQWCDEWIGELVRVLRPGRTCAILNIPIWAIRHYLYMEETLTFQNWIVWDALSFPVRLIMPAHYSILCFSKGPARPLPGLTTSEEFPPFADAPATYSPLRPLADFYCLRARCVRNRQQQAIDDREPLTDLWSDIHRLKHNSRRVDHPCQLPPHLMYRLISIFTEPGETVLDPFNGSGTSTLCAHQLNRNYIGIELSEKYHGMATERHNEIEVGRDPFRKEQRKLTEKNSSVDRLPQQVYEVPKKTLQLEVRRVAKILAKLPDRDEMIRHGKYPIKYYDDYFSSWGEVCAAARHAGMSEERENGHGIKSSAQQLTLFE
jgi:DNA modification methylase